MGIGEAPVIVVLIVSAIAALMDIRSGKIRNWITLPLIPLGLFLNTLLGGWQGLWSSLGGLCGATLMLVLLTSVMGIRLGGGDCKLIIGAGAVLGWPLALWFVLYTAVGGFVVALAHVIRRRNGKQVLERLVGYVQCLQLGTPGMGLAGAGDQQQRVPYGVAILLGSLAVIIWGPWL